VGAAADRRRSRRLGQLRGLPAPASRRCTRESGIGAAGAVGAARYERRDGTAADLRADSPAGRDRR
jgi:hypothetical protein